MSKHAILSASGAHRWLNCTPSARLELEFDDNSGEAAAENLWMRQRLLLITVY